MPDDRPHLRVPADYVRRESVKRTRGGERYKLDESLPLEEREIKCIVSLYDVLSDREKNAVAEKTLRQNCRREVSKTSAWTAT